MHNMLAMYVNVKYDDWAELLPLIQLAHNTDYNNTLEETPHFLIFVLDVLTPLSNFRTRIRRKDGTENFGGFVFVLDLYNGILCCGFLCARLISVSRLPRRGLSRPYRYIQANRLPRLQGYHTRATTLQANFWVQKGYHTCG